MTDYPSPWVFLIAVLASCRVTHFFLWDSLIGTHPDSGTKLGQAIERWAFTPNGEPRSLWRSKVGTLSGCPWCFSAYTTLLAVCLVAWQWPWGLGSVGWLTWAAAYMVACVLLVLDFKYLVE